MCQGVLCVDFYTCILYNLIYLFLNQGVFYIGFDHDIAGLHLTLLKEAQAYQPHHLLILRIFIVF